MPNYELGKIYKIVNDNIPGKVYYGSTSQKYLSTRFSRHKHKNNKCTSRELFIVEGARIELVETFPCNSVYELKNRERYYIENYECVNKKVPNRTQSELERNPEQKEKKKKKRETIYKERIQTYYKEHKEKIVSTQQKRYNDFKNSFDSLRIGCRACKKEVSLLCWDNHSRTKKHIHNSNSTGSKS